MKTPDGMESEPQIAPEVEAHNVRAFILCVLVTYIPAPVLYVGVVQAALCSWLGANATLSNLPASLFALGGLAPLLASWLIPFKWESSVAVWCCAAMGAMTGLTGAVLLLPVPNGVRVGVVVLASLATGILSMVQQVYLFQTLKRATTEQGRARALKIAYTAGPFIAVAGSLAAQAILDPSLFPLAMPVNFAALYFIATPCMLIAALAIRSMRLVPGEGRPRVALVSYLRDAATELGRSRPLLFLCASFAIWNVGMSAMPTLSLYTPHAVGLAPELLAGYVLALRFGCKSVSGYLYGWIAERFGTRYTLLAIQATLLAGMIWAATVSGYGYLGAFALLGGSELGGVYFPNQCLSLSSNEDGTRNLSLLMMAQTVGGVAATLHGGLADTYGFPASFALGAICALAAAWLIVRIPPKTSVDQPALTLQNS